MVVNDRYMVEYTLPIPRIKNAAFLWHRFRKVKAMGDGWPIHEPPKNPFKQWQAGPLASTLDEPQKRHGASRANFNQHEHDISQRIAPSRLVTADQKGRLAQK